MLSNILLDDLDKELEGRNHRFARYADDFVILVKSQRAGERVMASIARFLEQKLKLKVNLMRTAISVGLSRKGPWRLSRTLATQSGMTNQWLKYLGLLSVKDLWVNIHYPVTAW